MINLQHAFFFFISLTLTTAPLRAELIDLLDKDKMEKMQKIQTIFNDSGAPVILNQIEKEVTKKSKAPLKLKSQFDLIYEEEIAKEECKNCDPYMYLAKEIGHIVENLNTKSDVYTENQIIINLNELKALQYYVLAEQDNGNLTCQSKGIFEKVNKDAHFQDVELISEELLSINNLKSLQYLPEGSKEMTYIFKGISNDEESLVEIKVDQSDKVRVRYFKYSTPVQNVIFPFKKEQNLLEQVYAIKNGEGEKKDNTHKSIVIEPKLEFGGGIIPTDLKIGRAKKSFEMSENIDLQTTLEASFKEQEAAFTLKNNNGRDYLLISANYQHNVETKVKTAIPFHVEISKEHDINLNAQFTNYTKITNYETLDNTRVDDQEVNLSVKKGETNVLDVKYTSNEAQKYNKYTFANEGDYYLVGPLTTTYVTDSSGSESLSFSKHKDLGRRGVLSVELGANTEKGKFVNFGHQMKIGKTSSFVIKTETSEGHGVEGVFQFQSKF